MDGSRILLAGLISAFALDALGTEPPPPGDQPLGIPALGSHELRVLAPALLELSYVVPKKPGPARVAAWDFIDASGQCHLPAPQQFVVSSEGKAIPVKAVGFKRTVAYAPLKKWDLRVQNWLYLELGAPVGPDQSV